MKKFIAASMCVYSVVCIGSCIYMVIDPEGYGRLLGKISKGYVSALGLAEEAIGGEI